MAGLPDLPSVTARVARALTDAGVRHAVSGAMAMAAYGVVRATQDIDILIAVPSTRLPEVLGVLRNQGFSGDDREALASLRDRHSAELRSGTISVEIFVPVLPYHTALLDRTIELEVAGTPVRFVSADDLVLLKMLWHRTKDIADVQALLSAAESLDVPYLIQTLNGILPDDDPRHEELADLVRRFWRQT